MITQNERLARIKLNNFIYLRTDWINRLIEIFGSAEEILKQTARSLHEEAGLTISTAEHLLQEAHALDAQREIDLVEKCGGQILMYEDADYPQELRNIKEPPFVLYVRRSMSAPGPRVAMVGTRNITPYGRRCAQKFAGELTQAGCVVVSGLARGVDSICHKAAVDLKRPTFAVVGTGIGRCYPAENRALASAILDNGGAIISELPFDKPPHAFHFPRRNRIIAGLSCLTVVVEGRIKSGALITAKMALEQGKEVFALPGPIESVQSGGTNMLIKEGANVLLDTKDIIDSIPEENRFGLSEITFGADTAPAPEIADLGEDEKKIMDFIGSGAQNSDSIIDATGLNVAAASALLFELEVKGVLMCQNGMYSLNKFNKG